jgi:hypothetical protein
MVKKIETEDPRYLALIAVLLFVGFFIWIFSLHGTVAIFRVNFYFRMVFLILGFIGVLFSCLVFIKTWFEHKGRKQPLPWLSVLLITLTGFWIFIPVAGFSFINGFPASGPGDSPPRLLITPRQVNTASPICSL